MQVTSGEFMETFSGGCDFMLKSSEKTFQFLAFENFVYQSRLLKCFKDFQNFRSQEIMFLVSKVEPA